MSVYFPTFDITVNRAESVSVFKRNLSGHGQTAWGVTLVAEGDNGGSATFTLFSNSEPDLGVEGKSASPVGVHIQRHDFLKMAVDSVDRFKGGPDHGPFVCVRVTVTFQDGEFGIKLIGDTDFGMVEGQVLAEVPVLVEV
jgi:hypothetical protein